MAKNPVVAAEDMVQHLVESINPHNVELSRNAQGGFSISVKSFGASPKAARDEAVKVFDELCARYKAQAKVTLGKK